MPAPPHGSHDLKALDRITFDPAVMGGEPCIRGMRVTVGMIVGMVASLAAFLLRLLGTAVDHLGLEQRVRSGSRKRRAYSRLFLARLILMIESCRRPLIEFISSIGAADQWVVSQQDALFAG